MSPDVLASLTEVLKSQSEPQISVKDIYKVLKPLNQSIRVLKKLEQARCARGK